MRPTDQKVGDSSSSARFSMTVDTPSALAKVLVDGLPESRGAGGKFARPYKNPYRCRDELDL